MSRSFYLSEEFHRFASIAAEHSGLDYSEAEQICALLSRAEFTLHRLAEIECSVELTERGQRQLEAKQERLIATAKKRAEQLRAELVTSGDPRGAILRLLWPLNEAGERPYNSWGGKENGYYVPCRGA